MAEIGVVWVGVGVPLLDRDFVFWMSGGIVLEGREVPAAES